MMDLKSMLNVDAAGQRAPPRLTTGNSAHTPNSSYDGRIDHTPSGSSDVTSARPTPYGPPSHTGEPRAQSGGSYFAYPHTSTSNSTPSAGPPSAYAQSPSSYHQTHTPRDGLVVNHPGMNAAYATPSPGIYHPPTPGSAHHNQPLPNLLHQSSSSHHQYHYSSPPPPQSNGLPLQSQHRQISPITHFQSQPATPLGPPITYPRASPQSQRPPSQGGPVEQLRRASQSSVGSALSREYNHYPHPDLQRRDSVQSAQRTSYPYEGRDREQSMSVSPKTIPRPNPNRENSASSHTLSNRASLPPQPDHHSGLGHYSSPSQQNQPLPSQLVTPDMSVAGSRPTSHDQNTTSSPVPPTNNRSAMVQQEVKEEAQPSLKRGASHLEDSPSAAPPAPKRQRYDIPRWAHSRREQRGQRPIRYLDANEAARDRERRRQQDDNKKTMQQPQQYGAPHTNGAQNHIQQPVQPPQPVQHNEQNRDRARHAWEGTISNIVPNDSLTKRICDWIIATIGRAAIPPGSQWEVEAKIGTIHDLDTRHRFYVQGVDSEALLNTHELPRKIRFESNMPATSHEACYHYLRGCAERNHIAHKAGEVHDNMLIRHSQLRELDDFFELSPEGVEELDPQLRFWTERSITRGRHSNSVRVRKTIDLESNAPRYLIKSRIADKEISYYHDSMFDYRISISLESNWTGNEDHLRPLDEVGTRNKFRHSYRHREFQMDVTQVSKVDDPSQKDFEVEVEISGPYLADQMQKLLSGKDNKYMEMVQDFVNNTRLLCKHADVGNKQA